MNICTSSVVLMLKVFVLNVVSSSNRSTVNTEQHKNVDYEVGLILQEQHFECFKI